MKTLLGRIRTLTGLLGLSGRRSQGCRATDDYRTQVYRVLQGVAGPYGPSRANASGGGEFPMLMDNKAIIRRFYEEAWNKRRLEVVDELISPSHALNDPIVSGSQMGPELYKRRVVELTTSFPDLRFTIEDIITEKGKVVVSWIVSGTHQSEFMDIPATGSEIFVEGITIHDVTNGKILDSHARWDALDLVRQLREVCALGEVVAAAP